MERTLGVRLFERGSQGVELTTYGAALLNCGVAVFDEMRRNCYGYDVVKSFE